MKKQLDRLSPGASWVVLSPAGDAREDIYMPGSYV